MFQKITSRSRSGSSRRCFLRAGGVSLALPMLESAPRSALGQNISAIQADKPKRRMVAVNVELGLHPQHAGASRQKL